MTEDIGYLLVPFAFTLLCGVPVAMSLGLGVIVYLFFTDLLPFSIMTQQMYNASSSFPLMAIPFFIFAGDLMSESGITERLIGFCKLLLQRVRGGLAHSMVVTGTVFAGLTGSATADTAAIIKILGPAMEKDGYDKDFTAAVAASTGVLGPIIPPSTLMIVYGAVTSASVGGMFMGGILPGVLISSGIVLVVALTAHRRRYPKSDAPLTLPLLLIGLKDASFALVMPVIIIVGIRGGVFTPTEGGAVSVAYSLAIGFFVYRRLTVAKVLRSAVGSGVTAAIIMLIVAASAPFGWVITFGQVPQMLAETMLGYTNNPYCVLLIMNVILLIAGLFLESAAAVLLLGPILAPLAVGAGIDPVHFGVIVCVNLCIGMITPPVGVNLFVAAPVAGVSMTAIARAILPFLGVQLVALMLITYVPPITLWLPSLLR